MRVALALVLTSLVPNLAYPCDCGRAPPGAKEALRDSGLVVLGVVESSKAGVMTVKPQEVLKGQTRPQQRFRSPLSTCGFVFAAGEKVLIYAADTEEPTIAQCSSVRVVWGPAADAEAKTLRKKMIQPAHK